MSKVNFGNTKKFMVLLMTAVLLVVGVLGGFGGNTTVYAAFKTPKLIVTGADIEGGSVKAGDGFTMFILRMNRRTNSEISA